MTNNEKQNLYMINKMHICGEYTSIHYGYTTEEPDDEMQSMARNGVLLGKFM